MAVDSGDGSGHDGIEEAGSRERVYRKSRCIELMVYDEPAAVSLRESGIKLCHSFLKCRVLRELPDWEIRRHGQPARLATQVAVCVSSPLARPFFVLLSDCHPHQPLSYVSFASPSPATARSESTNSPQSKTAQA